MLVEECGHSAAVMVMLLHSYRQRLGPACGQPGVEGRDDRAHGVLQKADALGVFLSGRNDHSADTVAVTVEILRRRMHDDLRAPFDRPQKVRTQEGVVDDQADSTVAGQFTY